MEAMEDRTELNTRHQPLDRVRLRRPRRARRGGAPDRRERRRAARDRRERLRREPVRAGAARPGSADPHERRAAHLELHALAARVRRARVRRPLWPDFDERDLRARARRVRTAPPALRRPVSSFASRASSSPSRAARRARRRLPRRLVAVRARRGRRRCSRCTSSGCSRGRSRRSRRPATSAPCSRSSAPQLGGIDWMVGGVLATLPLAFALKGVSRTRQAPTAVDLGDGAGRGLDRLRPRRS